MIELQNTLIIVIYFKKLLLVYPNAEIQHVKRGVNEQATININFFFIKRRTPYFVVYYIALVNNKASFIFDKRAIYTNVG